MSSLLKTTNRGIAAINSSDLFLRHRLKVVEDIWESVLRSECGQELVDLLRRLRDACSPEGQAPEFMGSEVLKIVESLDLNQAIRAARAFALYFQLINIVEQHYEQREQLRAKAGSKEVELFPKTEAETYSSKPEAELLEKSWLEGLVPRRETGSFESLFPKLRKLNVPPKQIQKLLEKAGYSISVYSAPDGNSPPNHSSKTTADCKDFATSR